MGNVAHMGEERKVYMVLLEKPEGKRALRRPRHRWEDGIKMDLREIGWEGVAQDMDRRWVVVNTIMNRLVLAHY
jgi:hypothetical protein